MKTQLFRTDLPWFKGNLHCHSTVSDGFCTPEALAELYRIHGYSFLIFSEHEIYTEPTSLNQDDFLILGGIERSIQLSDECFHINGIRDYTQDHFQLQDQQWMPIPADHSIQDVQKIIDELKTAGCLTMINHPYWSFNRLSSLEVLKNYDLIELYNFGCDQETGCGDSSKLIDELLEQGKSFYVTATDDNHNKNKRIPGEMTEWDSFGGFIMVQCESLTPANLCQAIKDGRFYASEGPQLRDLTADEGMVHVECSPCERVIFYTYPRRGYTFDSEIEAHPITHCDYALAGNEAYVRVILIDNGGRRAWSQPLRLI